MGSFEELARKKRQSRAPLTAEELQKARQGIGRVVEGGGGRFLRKKRGCCFLFLRNPFFFGLVVFFKVGRCLGPRISLDPSVSGPRFWVSRGRRLN